MQFTPDEIANRVFTPSAEGYHPGEVRDFLARIASQVSELISDAGSTGVTAPSTATDMMSSAVNVNADLAQTIDDRLLAIEASLAELLVRPMGRPAGEFHLRDIPANAAPVGANRSAFDPVESGLRHPDQLGSDRLGSDRLDSGQAIDSAPFGALTDVPADLDLPRSAADTPARRLPRIPETHLGDTTSVRPVFSDTANILLDDVVSDVMQNVTNEPEA